MIKLTQPMAIKRNNKIMKRLAAHIIYKPRAGKFLWKISGLAAGKVHGKGYLAIRFKNVHIYAHRLAWWMFHKKTPNVMDHIDGNKLNNKISNLRSGTHAENSRNLKCHREGKPYGVSIRKDRGRWIAENRHGKPRYLGSFKTPQEAHKAYLKATNGR